LRRQHVVGRQSHSNGTADQVDAGAWGGAQQRATAVLLDPDGAEIRQIVDLRLAGEMLSL
jgi:hypothetical protein